MTEQQQPEKSIFLSAIEISSMTERAEYLDKACAGNESLRAQIEALMEAHEKSQPLMDNPAVSPPTMDTPLSECPGTVIGPYKLLQQIGEGGMGVVWMAEQTQPVQRKVALKVIKPGMDSRQVIARFEAERQALAMMDHVNIARVFDGGMISHKPEAQAKDHKPEAQAKDQQTAPSLALQACVGRPYFVMELVHGVPITKYCDDNHLTPRQRLELFVPVCQAIQHAHQKGIIHRDIKPSNVMVTLYDGKPVPKVIDFGVAKATEQKLTERTLFTHFGTMVGTLEYMSPEQAEMSALGVDTRSDIYSLGVLLYELLTGSTPLTSKRMKEAAYAEILRMIKEEEPPKPSTRLTDSGEALASISAQRKTEPAKLTKLVKGELDWIVMKTLEKDRNRRYETAKDFAADVQRYLTDEPVQACPPSALYRFRKFARRNKAGLATAGLVLFFIVLLGGVVGWALRNREAREQEIALETARKLALTEQGIRQALDRAATSRAELHAILKKPGGVQQLLNQPARWELFIKTAHGEFAQARQLAVRAEGSLDAEWTQAMDKLEQQLTSDQADYDLALRLEKIRLDRATWAEGSFDNRKAADEYSKAFAGFAVLTDDPAAVAARLGSSPIKEQLVAALDEWAWLAFYLLRKQDLAEQLLALARQAAPDPVWGDRLRQPEVWRDQEALGKLVAEAPAAGLSPQLLLIVGRLLGYVDSPLRDSWLRQAQAEHPADFWLNYLLATALSKTKPVEAVGFYRVALAVRPGSSAVYNDLGNALKDQGKLDEAIAAFHKAIEIDPKHAFAHKNLGTALAVQGKLDEAVAWLRMAIKLDPKYALAHFDLAHALHDQKKLDEAIGEYRKAIELDPKHVGAHNNLGNLLHDQKKLDEAIGEYRKAIELDPKHADAHINLGVLLCDDLRDYENAAGCFRKAIELDPKNVIAHHNLGNALLGQGKVDAAIAECREAIRLDKDCPEAHNGLATALAKKGELDDAIRESREAIRLKKDFGPFHYNLANDLRDKGRLDEAIAEYREAIRLKPDFAEAHVNLGSVLQANGQMDDAITEYREAIRLKPDLAEAHTNLGHALSDQQKLPEAISAFRKAIELDPKNAKAHYGLGNVLGKKGQRDAAITEYREAIRLKPDFAEAHVNLGDALLNKGQPDAAIAEFREAIRIKKDLPQAYNGLGKSLGRQGKLDDAIAAFKEGIRLNPQSALAHNNFGCYLCDELKDYDKAIECFRNAIELDAKHVDAHGNLAIALRRQGKIEEAIASYEKSLQLDPKSALTLNNLAYLLATCPEAKFRDAKRAVELARRAVELKPQEGNYWNTLGEALYRAGSWKDAVAALEKSMQLRKGGDSFDWFFLAMAHWKLGEKDKAREWYDRAVQWMDKNQPKNEELRRFRAEAEELMKIERK